MILNLSTTLALVSMIHKWLTQTDGYGATIGIILFDYRKTFDLVDHEILVGKVRFLDLPVSVINWIINFISDRYQRIKLADDCFSERCKVLSGIPRETKLGPWLFLTMTNDLTMHDERL